MEIKANKEEPIKQELTFGDLEIGATFVVPAFFAILQKSNKVDTENFTQGGLIPAVWIKTSENRAFAILDKSKDSKFSDITQVKVVRLLQLDVELLED